MLKFFLACAVDTAGYSYHIMHICLHAVHCSEVHAR